MTALTGPTVRDVSGGHRERTRDQQDAAGRGRFAQQPAQHHPPGCKREGHRNQGLAMHPPAAHRAREGERERVEAATKLQPSCNGRARSAFIGRGRGDDGDAAVHNLDLSAAALEAFTGAGKRRRSFAAPYTRPGLALFITDDWIASRCGWTPFHGMRVRGWPRMTIIRGNLVACDGEVLGEPVGRPVIFRA